MDKASSKQLAYVPIHKQNQIFKINKADLVYLDLGSLDHAIELWISQLKEIFIEIGNMSSQKRVARSRKNSHFSQLSYGIYKSVKIAHKIFYACLANYRLKKLIQFINNFFEVTDDMESSYSPFNLLDCTFKYLQPKKPLQKTHLAIVAVIKSLARFMALYFSNKEPLLIYSVNNPVTMNSLLEKDIDQGELILKLIFCFRSSRNVVYLIFYL